MKAFKKEHNGQRMHLLWCTNSYQYTHVVLTLVFSLSVSLAGVRRSYIAVLPARNGRGRQDIRPSANRRMGRDHGARCMCVRVCERCVFCAM